MVGRNLELYSVVRIVSGDLSQVTLSEDLSIRAPKIGDIATVLLIYSDPLGYELECVSSDGDTEWVGTFPGHLIESTEALAKE